MKQADIVLTPIPQTDGKVKNRPVAVLRKMPSHGDFLVCGISTQLHHRIPAFDEIISPEAPDFEASGLLSESLIRLGFLAVLPRKRLRGSIGSISSDRHERLLKTLSDYLSAQSV